MDKDNFITKKKLIQLLDRGLEFDQLVFDSFDGEEFAFDDTPLNITGLEKPFELLIPKTYWTKEDFTRTRSQISIVGITKDKDDKKQLLIELDDIPQTYETTSDAISQLFDPMKLNKYIAYLLDDTTDHFEHILHNFEYWFRIHDAERELLIRTVQEEGKYIARCFASTKYRPIDNHALLYITCHALNKLDLQFNLQSFSLKHSEMKLNILSEDKISIPNVGILTYGFTVFNSETKEKAVGFHPTFELTNDDASHTTLILDKPISIYHRGTSIEPIIEKLEEVENLNEHLRTVISTIEVAKTEKVTDKLAYTLSQEITNIVGKTKFKKFEKQYLEIARNNTYNLLQFFGRLHELDVDDDEKELKLKVMFWKTLYNQINNED
ncbi:hypothetical protein [Chengkuizengella axinellae]|uniref:Uncharacterized protein n=1 Tax=Chengkuizengella axinellae TaxID=3064388 RepID=A0ABT9J3W0_9BACL|nr:hypothetical protein [Chengkuizengella sp. 2205SS18-9]MDP5276178.1 hypothetical protein [Chengkuizengella sp. 2205SS18-9]